MNFDTATANGTAHPTPVRDLHTGTTVWDRHSLASLLPSEHHSHAVTGVVIVGAGISGALLAYRLTERGIPTLVVDRRAPLCGSTAASTALLQFELDVPLHQLIEQIGRERAHQGWQRSLQSVHSLVRIIRRERIFCGLRTQRSLYLAGDALDAAGLRREVHARKGTGLPSWYLAATSLRQRFGIERDAALLSQGSAIVDPVKLTHGLLRVAILRHARLVSPVEVVQAVEHDNAAHVVLGDGTTVTADALVWCTGYEVPKVLRAVDHEITSTWAIAATATPAPPAWFRDCVIWEASDPYLYVRSLGGGRVVAGGEDEPSATAHEDRGRLCAKSERIATKLEQLMPGHAFTVTHAWSGAFGTSTTGLPFIGRIPDRRHMYAAHGFGGNGITHSMTAADVLTAEIVKQRERGSGRPHTRKTAAGWPRIAEPV